MQNFPKLPEAEYELMQIVWSCEPPMSTLDIYQRQGEGKKLKIQSVMTLLLRLINRGFLRTEKRGKNRIYYPLVERDEYLRFETERFVKRFYYGSASSIVTALYKLDKVSSDDLRQISEMEKIN
ncbi:MAG: BlaI/MecI/CopY family transcriptional regulator [Defluviitaleaceae bacterium]|nr:BlaI/MecI/CopY family transcriptional regulator [Defluviitaleaceae bacterium]